MHRLSEQLHALQDKTRQAAASTQVAAGIRVGSAEAQIHNQKSHFCALMQAVTAAERSGRRSSTDAWGSGGAHTGYVGPGGWHHAPASGQGCAVSAHTGDRCQISPVAC